MSRLAKNNKVLFAEYPFTIKDVVTSLMRKEYDRALRMIGFRSRLSIKQTTVGSQVYQWILPPMIPSDFIRNEKIYRLVLHLNSLIYRRSIKKAFRRLDMQNIININAYNPSYGYFLAGYLNEKANLYYCYDGINPNHFPKVAEYDKLFSRKVDSVIVSSDYLKAQKSKLNNKVFTVKNGVDFDSFFKSAKTTPNTSLPKRIGYIGSIDQRFDLEKVEYAVQNLPDYQFEFTGDLRNEEVKARLSHYSNVSFLPPIPPGDVPHLLNSYDAGIIPYVADEMNRNVYPLKINEFLAVGVPVIMSRFAHLPEFDEYISTASSKEEFSEAILNEIKTDSPARINHRIEFAQSNSWDKKAMELSNAIIMSLTDI
jgi:hypothetical protein